MQPASQPRGASRLRAETAGGWRALERPGAVIKLVSPQRQASYLFIQPSKALLCTRCGLFTFPVLSSTAWPRHERSPRRG